MFGRTHLVEDPVGGRPVRSDEPGALARFWDAFIEPNEIEFRVEQDWVDGFDVVRDVTILSTLRAGVRVSTPAHLIYQTGYEDGVLKVRRMAAHWESLPVYCQLARPSRAHVAAGIGQFVHMFGTLGLGATLQFVGAVRSVGRRGKRVVLAALGEQGIGGVRKVIASGDTVTATVTIDGAPAAVIARLEPRSRTVVEMRIYTDPA